MDDCGHWCTLSVFMLLVAVETCTGCSNQFNVLENTMLVSTTSNATVSGLGLPMFRRTIPLTDVMCFDACVGQTTCVAYVFTRLSNGAALCLTYTSYNSTQSNSSSTAYIRVGCTPGCSGSSFNKMANSWVMAVSDGITLIWDATSNADLCRSKCVANTSCRAYDMHRTSKQCGHYTSAFSVYSNSQFDGYMRAGCLQECTTDVSTDVGTVSTGKAYRTSNLTDGSDSACRNLCINDAKCVEFSFNINTHTCSLFSSFTTIEHSVNSSTNSYRIRHCLNCPYKFVTSINTKLNGHVLVDFSNQTLYGESCVDKCTIIKGCAAASVKKSDNSCIIYSSYTLTEDIDYTSYILESCNTGCNTTFVAITGRTIIGDAAYRRLVSIPLGECQNVCLHDGKCVAIAMKAGLCYIYYNVVSMATSTDSNSFNITRCLYHNGNWGSWTYSSCSVTCGTGTRNKTRLCNNPAPSVSYTVKGTDCVGVSTTVESCEENSCTACVDTTTHLPNIQLQAIMTSGKTDYCGSVCMDDAHCHAYVVYMNKSCFLINEYTNATRASGIDTYLVRHCESCPRTFSQSKNTTLTGTVLRHWGVLPETDAGSCLEKCTNDTRCTGYIIRNGDRDCTTYSNSYLTETDQDTSYTAYLLSNCDVGCNVEFTPIPQTLLTSAYSSNNSRFFSSTDNCKRKCQQDVKCRAISTRSTDNLCSIVHEYESRPDASYTSYTIQRCIYFDGNWGLWAYSGCSVTCGHGTRTKTRVCNNPAPTGKGMTCVGQATDVQTCIPQPCQGT